MRRIRFLMQIFSMVVTGVVFAVAVFTTVLNPIEAVESRLFWQIPLVSAVCTLVSLIYPRDREMGKVEAIVKTLIHYVLVNVIVLGSGLLFYWYDPTQFSNIAAMALAIALIFGAITVISWKKSAAAAARMNERLAKYQRQTQQSEDEN